LSRPARDKTVAPLAISIILELFVGHAQDHPISRRSVVSVLLWKSDAVVKASNPSPHRPREDPPVLAPSADPVAPSPDADSPASDAASPESLREREIRFEHALNLAQLLAELRLSLVLSTYQAGKVAVLGSHQGKLNLSFHNFERPMGVALDAAGDRLAVAGKNCMWLLRNSRDLAARLSPERPYDACYLTRSSHVTGEIQTHEIAWAGDRLWLVNTLFSCLATLEPDYSFVPHWRPPFISRLAPEDRCHLNGLALDGGKPKYVTAMSETDTPAGWRANKAHTGCLIDVESGEVVVRGLAMPHSPRVHLGHVWVLDSGRGALAHVDVAAGKLTTVARFPGYTRGMAMMGKYAFICLSKIRETSTFNEIPIAENRERLKCGIAVLDLHSGQLVSQFEFTTGVDELFDVCAIPAAPLAYVHGPFATQDGAEPIWMVPKG
jgi:uncharacterized protein (TIGR03032 family)